MNELQKKNMIEFDGRTPVIKADVDKIVERVTNRIAELDLDNMKATEDNLAKLRKLRTELKNEVKEYDNERKRIEALILKDFKSVTGDIKVRVIAQYDESDKILKKKIDKVMQARADEDKALAKAYFEEEYKASRIEFIKFEHIEISYKNPKQIKLSIDNHFKKIRNDLTIIDLQDNKDEVRAAYMNNGFNISEAIIEVKDYHERLEKTRQEALEKEQGSIYDNEIEVIEVSDEVIELEEELVFEEVVEVSEEELEEELEETTEEDPVYEYEILFKCSDAQISKILEYAEELGIEWDDMNAE